MAYRFTVINTYGAFMKELESEHLCTDSTALVTGQSFFRIRPLPVFGFVSDSAYGHQWWQLQTRHSET
jgi:hypothetical protein